MNLHFHEMKSREMKWVSIITSLLFTYSNSADCADCLHFQSQLIASIEYVSNL